MYAFRSESLYTLDLLMVLFIGLEFRYYNYYADSRPAKSPGISGSLQKWRVISRSPGIVKKSPGMEVI